ncbi:MAG: tRNA (adenosine(37)-N6)-threonylcarbamoyltransferase complex transferase subunit TsaD [Proteobacteria bacterium]|nr:tRNA (adenosine(37)-N6)-threonylcarbamoyltransferase complex transferase subunit TsaD [Desulfobulbaceae bacterium]MBU4152379.1 tRNA (adenosine(37)-N6)-threonylcarbamoyltransferase complex transferase subunit TsaD [Pseudomonadota bacterium]MDP2105257.1 tRNA (adenosine(37)-N6)-threonylcarbamoyltransferase complex transferase subunit TsaD [Desulfobulbaceae bacterium]
MIILGVESSCDETAAAVLAHGELVANVINSQIDIHRRYGGVVPELASRHHLENIYPVVQAALDEAGITLEQLDGMAVTQGPGLVGALLIGLSFVKAISLVKKIPYVGVDHLAGHLLSVFLGDKKPKFPFIALIASGGHSSIFLVTSFFDYQILGRSRDDAAGEAFDKAAKLLGLPYPGGPIVSQRATEGNRKAIAFPRAWLAPDSLDFSFSGVKTSVANHVNECRKRQLEPAIADICASFQEAVAEVLVVKTIKAAEQRGIKRVVVAGGVAANPRLREIFSAQCADRSISLYLTPSEFCTDNAAMIALAGSYQFEAKKTLTYDMDAYSRTPILQ